MVRDLELPQPDIRVLRDPHDLALADRLPEHDDVGVVLGNQNVNQADQRIAELDAELA